MWKEWVEWWTKGAGKYLLHCPCPRSAGGQICPSFIMTNICQKMDFSKKISTVKIYNYCARPAGGQICSCFIMTNVCKKIWIFLKKISTVKNSDYCARPAGGQICYCFIMKNCIWHIPWKYLRFTIKTIPSLSLPFHSLNSYIKTVCLQSNLLQIDKLK